MIAPAIVEVGSSSQICERRLCAQRAAAPVNRTAFVEQTMKSVSSFPFVV
jgi:XRE family transcriptional regulator, fatty acid utilization regulator